MAAPACDGCTCVTNGFHRILFRYEKRQWKKFSRMLWKGANAALVRMSSGGMKGEQERIGAAQTFAAHPGRNTKSAKQDEMESPTR